MSKGGPNFLTVQHPLITIEFGLSLQTCDVRAGARLGEHLTPHRARRNIVGHELTLLFFGTELTKHRQAHAVADGQFKCHVGVLAVLFAIDAIVSTRQSGAAVLFAVHQSGKASLD